MLADSEIADGMILRRSTQHHSKPAIWLLSILSSSSDMNNADVVAEIHDATIRHSHCGVTCLHEDDI